MRNINQYGADFLQDYEQNDFEVVEMKYRRKKVHELLESYPAKNVLEIGCVIDPFFVTYQDYEKMTVVEPADVMYESAKKHAERFPDKDITIIHDFIENQSESLQKINFDMILCVSLIHEVEDPQLLLDTIAKLCHPDTYVVLITNNAKSFHQILAIESGLVSGIGHLSTRAKKMQRHNSFTHEQMDEMLRKNHFTTVETGSFFVKPFTHAQMKSLLDQKIITMDIIDGLDRMIKYMPELGAENYWVIKLSEAE